MISYIEVFPSKARCDNDTIAKRVLDKRRITVGITKDNISSLRKSFSVEVSMATIITLEKLISEASVVGIYTRYDGGISFT